MLLAGYHWIRVRCTVTSLIGLILILAATATTTTTTTTATTIASTRPALHNRLPVPTGTTRVAGLSIPVKNDATVAARNYYRRPAEGESSEQLPNIESGTEYAKYVASMNSQQSRGGSDAGYEATHAINLGVFAPTALTTAGQRYVSSPATARAAAEAGEHMAPVDYQGYPVLHLEGSPKAPVYDDEKFAYDALPASYKSRPKATVGDYFAQEAEGFESHRKGLSNFQQRDALGIFPHELLALSNIFATNVETDEDDQREAQLTTRDTEVEENNSYEQQQSSKRQRQQQREHKQFSDLQGQATTVYNSRLQLPQLKRRLIIPPETGVLSEHDVTSDDLRGTEQQASAIYDQHEHHDIPDSNLFKTTGQIDDSLQHMHNQLQQQRQQFAHLQLQLQQHANQLQLQQQQQQHLITARNILPHSQPSSHPPLPPITQTVHHTAASAAAVAGIPLAKHVHVSKHVPTLGHYQQQHVPYKQTVPIEIPRAIITPVPRPYPIHIPVPKTIAVPQLKEVKIPIEKIRPVPVERSIPFIVERRVPYRVIKQVATPYYYPYPIKVPVVKTIVHRSPHQQQSNHHQHHFPPHLHHLKPEHIWSTSNGI